MFFLHLVMLNLRGTWLVNLRIVIPLVNGEHSTHCILSSFFYYYLFYFYLFYFYLFIYFLQCMLHMSRILNIILLYSLKMQLKLKLLFNLNSFFTSFFFSFQVFLGCLQVFLKVFLGILQVLNFRALVMARLARFTTSKDRKKQLLKWNLSQVLGYKSSYRNKWGC